VRRINLLGRDVRFFCAILLLGCRTTTPSCTAPECGRRVAPHPSASAPEAAKVLTSLPAPDDAGKAKEDAVWVDRVRAERWDEASAAVEALPEIRKQQPALLLLRARLAMFRGDGAGAVKLLDGLEHSLAFVAEDIERWRAEAELVAGPFADAAQYYKRRSGGHALAKAATAEYRAGHSAEARALADRAIVAGALGAEEASVRALRLKIAEAAGDRTNAADDARWICLRAPAREEAAAAEQALGRLDPSHPLTGKERLGRADKLSEAGRVPDALAELARAAAAATAPPGSDEIDWARAYVLYKSRADYDKAAQAFDRLGAQRGPRQAEALLQAARARSRADHDDAAVKGYEDVTRRFPGTTWADDATYLAARLSLLHGRWAEAAARYAGYLKTYPAGRQHDAADYERAVCLLASGQGKKARADLHRLAAATTSALEAARLRELEGVAAQGDGDRDLATKLWQEVNLAQPLTWPALAARARLAQLGVAAPRLIDPADDKPAQPLSVRLPDGAELYHRLGLDGDAESYLRAHEREATQGLGPRDKEALCSLYDDIGRATRRYRIAIEAVSAEVLSRAASASSQWAWSCVYPRPYADMVAELEARDALPRGLLYAVMRQESAYDPDAVSPARAVGLLQLMPDTARKIAAESGIPFDEKWLRSPATNLDLGARYLTKMMRTFDGSAPLAVAAYNAGPRAVTRWIERMHGAPLDVWAALIPYEETRTYVVRVMSNLARYSFFEGGETAVPQIDLAPPKPGGIDASAY
jgi:soluble lytic murein transglycosylase